MPRDLFMSYTSLYPESQCIEMQFCLFEFACFSSVSNLQAKSLIQCAVLNMRFLNRIPKLVIDSGAVGIWSVGRHSRSALCLLINVHYTNTLIYLLTACIWVALLVEFRWF